MYTTLRKVLLASTLSMMPLAVLADTTAQLYLYEINVDLAGSTYYFRAATAPGSATPVAWGVSGCPNATHAYARVDPLINQVYATALAAQLAGKPVIFAGTCDSDGVHFRVTHIMSRG